MVVRETRNRLRAALNVVPQSLWDGLVLHLHKGDQIADWSYNRARINQLYGHRPEVKPTADDWSQGIFNGSSVTGAWRPIVKARACCGVTVPANPTGPLELDQLAAIVVWLERGDGRRAMSDHIPDVLDAARQSIDANGRARDI